VNRTQFSVNVNKIALLRNSRGENKPDVLAFSMRCIELGADGITVHPRPDARHITYDDVKVLKNALSVELNVEGYPSQDFIDMVCNVKPAQVTLVPDPPDALTSSFGWDTATHHEFLTSVVDTFRSHHIRVSLFVDPHSIDYPSLISINPDRVELYTYDYAKHFADDPSTAIEPYIKASKKLKETGIDLNAGHDLNQDNLSYLLTHIPEIKEVSIGHALVIECLYQGLDHCIKQYVTAISNVFSD